MYIKMAVGILLLLCFSTSMSQTNNGAFFDRDTRITCSVAAMVGGALGAAINDKKREKGALYGSIIAGGACIAIKYYQHRIRSRNEVAKEYFKENKILPSKTKVQSYYITTKPEEVIERGGKLEVFSQLEVVQGAKEKKLDITENIFIFDKRTGKLVDNYQKSLGSEGVQGGEYGNTYKVRVSDKIRPGEYDVRTVLTINGNHTKSNDVTITVL